MTDDPTPETSVDQVADAAHDAAVVDVREPAEVAQGHIRGAVLMPMGQLAGRMSELDSSRIQAWVQSGRSVDKGTR